MQTLKVVLNQNIPHQKWLDYQNSQWIKHEFITLTAKVILRLKCNIPTYLGNEEYQNNTGK